MTLTEETKRNQFNWYGNYFSLSRQFKDVNITDELVNTSILIRIFDKIIIKTQQYLCRIG